MAENTSGGGGNAGLAFIVGGLLVVVSIVNWNTPAATLECLDAIARLAYPRLRTIIVDNASRDDSVARLRARAATVLRSPRNEGFAAGHARAWHEAEGCGADAIALRSTR